MRGKDLGWGRLNSENLRFVMALHTAYADLARRTPYLARAHSGRLLATVADSIRQAVEGKPVAGALGPASTKILLLSGHDTNLSNISGMLGLNWILPGYAADDTPPGGALVFELWKDSEGDYVRTRYVAQSLEQMQEATALTGAASPLQTPVFMPACSNADEGYPCGWREFHRIVDAAIGR